MPNYDLNVILAPNLNEAQLRAEKDAIDALAERYGAEITSLDEWGNTRLAYEINKYREGYYLIYTFTTDQSETPKAFEGSLRLRDNIMRALVVRDRPEWRTQKPRKSEEAASA